jgi:hypothetical protein
MWVPQPSGELRQLGPPLYLAQRFTEHVTGNMAAWVTLAREQISRRASDLSLGSSEFVIAAADIGGDPLMLTYIAA